MATFVRYCAWTFTALCWISVNSTGTAENWPHWRGPTYNGISTETVLPTTWSKDKNIAWRLPLPGPAGASPIVWNDRIFLTSLDGRRLMLLAIDTDGELQWERQVAVGNRDARGDEGNFASPTPATDGERVIVLMGGGQLAAYDLAGNEEWAVDLNERYEKIDIQFGYASSPVLHDDRVYLQVIHGSDSTVDEQAFVVCFDAADGSEVWKTRRLTGAYAENKHSYASPILYPFGDGPYLITHGGDFTVAYDLADGSERWRCGGLNPHGNYHETLRFVTSPGVSKNLVVVPSAKNGPILGVSPSAQGNLTESDDILWRRDSNTPDVPSPLVHAGIVYLCRENGNLLCLEAETGKEIYEKRTVQDRHRASPVYADGHVYLAARNGTVTVVKAGREFEIVAKNKLGEDMSASPAISGGTIYLRTFAALYAIRSQ